MSKIFGSPVTEIEKTLNEMITFSLETEVKRTVIGEDYTEILVFHGSETLKKFVIKITEVV